MVDKLGFVVDKVSDIMYILKEPKEVLVDKWENNKSNAGYTAFGIKPDSNNKKFRMVGYCTTHNCGKEVLTYMCSKFDRTREQVVVVPAKTLKEMGY